MKENRTFRKFTFFVCVSLLGAWITAAVFTGSPNLHSPVYAQTDGNVPGKALGNKSDADFWRQVRRGKSFNLSGTAIGTPVLIQSYSEQWLLFRNGPLTKWGGILILSTLSFLVLFYLIRGRINITGGRTGKVVPRTSQPERWVHWFVASLFILLGISGMMLMFGRNVISPIIGKEVWSAVASAAMQAHNLLGPVFVVALLTMLVVYFKDNLWQKGDLTWALKGGFLSKGHPPSWKYNLGEKSWYWLLFFAGLAISTSGLLLNFPWLIENIEQLQLAHVIHGVAALILIAASIGHIYLGTIGVEGALDGMTYGYVDEKWAEEHHGWWAEQVTKKDDAPAE